MTVVIKILCLHSVPMFSYSYINLLNFEKNHISMLPRYYIMSDPFQNYIHSYYAYLSCGLRNLYNS